MEDIMTQPSRRSPALYVFGLLAVLCIGWVAYTLLTGSEIATFRQGQAEIYTARVADNALERSRGLSGVNYSDLHEDGMLFVFDKAEVQSFWMDGMTFNLDFIWIRDGKIVKIDKNIPYPAHGTDPVQVDSSPLLVDMVLEVPAGMAQQMGYFVGHSLTIDLDAE